MWDFEMDDFVTESTETSINGFDVTTDGFFFTQCELVENGIP